METRYTIRGSFEGDVAILADSIEVRLARGLLVNSLRMRVPHQRIFADVQIAVLLAETQGDRWRPRVSSRPIPIASVM